MSDYKRGKREAETWADRFAKFMDAANRSTNPLAAAVDYRTRVSSNAYLPELPRGVEFSDPTLRKTHHIIFNELPVSQRQEVLAYLFSQDAKRETSSIRAIYRKIGRLLR